MENKPNIPYLGEKAGQILVLAGLLAVGLLIGSGVNDLLGNTEDPAINSSNWQQTQLVDVRDGENFTVAELEKPLIVETFAVWCPTCTRQQQEIQELHQNTNITSVSLDVDPNEDREKVLEHIEREGFDWYYAVAPSELTRKLVEEYDSSIANPPSAPMILVCENGTRKLENGVKTASEIKEQIDQGC